MSILKLEKINKYYGTKSILENVSFALEKGQKIALVGYNGVGKSTLLKIIAGEEEFDGGNIILKKNATVGYLPQDLGALPDESVEDILWRGKNQADGKFKAEALSLLAGFGFKEEVLGFSINSLSSGQKTKIQLINILLKEPDLILLDEPNNNLDIPSLIWLETYLVKSDSTCLVVSHDKSFLDKIADGVMELDWDKKEIKFEYGSYSAYLKRREDYLKRQKEKYSNQRDQIEKLEKAVDSLKKKPYEKARQKTTDNDKSIKGFRKNKASAAAGKAKVIEKRIGQMEEIDNPSERKNLKISLGKIKNQRSFWVKLSEVVIGYDNGFCSNPFSLDISFGEKIAVLGLNGSGKSTLLKTISGEIPPLSGKRSVGSKVFLGNVTQEYNNLPLSVVVVDFMMESSQLKREEVFSLLNKFDLSEKNVLGKIKSLSPGEKARLLFALFTVQQINLLVLDEPTNNLDIETLEALGEMLREYQGSLVVVSHDRSFLKKLSLDKILVIEGKNLRTVPSLEDYLEEIEKVLLKNKIR